MRSPGCTVGDGMPRLVNQPVHKGHYRRCHLTFRLLLLAWRGEHAPGTARYVFYAENGPFQLTEDGGVEEREHAWDVTSNVIFVDSPIGTGFSYSDDPRDRVLNETTLAADMLDFLEEFFEGALLLPTVCLRRGFTKVTVYAELPCQVCDVSGHHREQR